MENTEKMMEGGYLEGNSHANGGIKIKTPEGQIEAEGGETIINKRSMESQDILICEGTPKEIASKVNEYGGGVEFAEGGNCKTVSIAEDGTQVESNMPKEDTTTFDNGGAVQEEISTKPETKEAKETTYTITSLYDSELSWQSSYKGIEDYIKVEGGQFDCQQDDTMAVCLRKLGLRMVANIEIPIYETDFDIHDDQTASRGTNLRSTDKDKRPSPSISATIFPVGYTMQGNDGNMWQINEDSRGIHRWGRVKAEDGLDITMDNEDISRLEKLKKEGKLKRYLDVRGNGKKVFETIIPNKSEKGMYKRYESTSQSSLGTLQNEYLDENDVLNWLKKTSPKYNKSSTVEGEENFYNINGIIKTKSGIVLNVGDDVLLHNMYEVKVKSINTDTNSVIVKYPDGKELLWGTTNIYVKKYAKGSTIKGGGVNPEYLLKLSNYQIVGDIIKTLNKDNTEELDLALTYYVDELYDRFDWENDVFEYQSENDQIGYEDLVDIIAIRTNKSKSKIKDIFNSNIAISKKYAKGSTVKGGKYLGRMGNGGGIDEYKIWKIIYEDKGVQKSILVEGYSDIVETNNWINKNPTKEFIQIQLYKNKMKTGGGIGVRMKITDWDNFNDFMEETNNKYDYRFEDDNEGVIIVTKEVAEQLENDGVATMLMGKMGNGGGVGDKKLGVSGRQVKNALFDYWSNKEKNESAFWKERGEYNIGEMVEMASEQEKFGSLTEETIEKFAKEFSKNKYAKGSTIKGFVGGVYDIKNVDTKLSLTEVSEIAEETANILGSEFSVTKNSIDIGSFDLDFNGDKYAGGSYAIMTNGDVVNVALPNKPIYYNYKTKNKYGIGGFLAGVGLGVAGKYFYDKNKDEIGKNKKFNNGGLVEYDIEYKDEEGDTYSTGTINNYEEAKAELKRLKQEGFKITQTWKWIDGEYKGEIKETGGNIENKKFNNGGGVGKENADNVLLEMNESINNFEEKWLWYLKNDNLLVEFNLHYGWVDEEYYVGPEERMGEFLKALDYRYVALEDEDSNVVMVSKEKEKEIIKELDNIFKEYFENKDKDIEIDNVIYGERKYIYDGPIILENSKGIPEYEKGNIIKEEMTFNNSIGNAITRLTNYIGTHENKIVINKSTYTIEKVTPNFIRVSGGQGATYNIVPYFPKNALNTPSPLLVPRSYYSLSRGSVKHTFAILEDGSLFDIAEEGIDVNINEPKMNSFKSTFTINNNYKGKRPFEIWDAWNEDQRKHFLKDHDIKNLDNSKIKEYTFDELPLSVKIAVRFHKNSGQYVNGGIIGKRIKIIKMNDPYPVEPGTMGTVKFIDDNGQIHVNWDNGRTLAIIPRVDEYQIM